MYIVGIVFKINIYCCFLQNALKEFILGIALFSSGSRSRDCSFDKGINNQLMRESVCVRRLSVLELRAALV